MKTSQHVDHRVYCCQHRPQLHTDAVHGHPSGDGSSGRPFVTLQAALDAVHARRLGDACVTIHQGRYTSPLLIGPEHSGLTLVAADGEKPSISGGIKVSGWQQLNSSLNVWRATTPPGQPAARQLYIDGERASRTKLWWPSASWKVFGSSLIAPMGGDADVPLHAGSNPSSCAIWRPTHACCRITSLANMPAAALPLSLTCLLPHLPLSLSLPLHVPIGRPLELVWMGGCKEHAPHCAPGQHSYREARCPVHSVVAAGSFINVTVREPCFSNTRQKSQVSRSSFAENSRGFLLAHPSDGGLGVAAAAAAPPNTCFLCKDRSRTKRASGESSGRLGS